jgi:hypothetical protein
MLSHHRLVFVVRVNNELANTVQKNRWVFFVLDRICTFLYAGTLNIPIHIKVVS